MTSWAWWRSAALLLVLVAALVVARLWPGAGDPSAEGPAPPGTAAEAGRQRGRDLAGRDPAEVMALARQALVGARSVRLRGTFDDAGRPLSMDVRLLAGGDASGWVASEGRRLGVIAAGGRTYLRGHEGLARWGSQAMADYVGDRWVLVPPSALRDLGAMAVMTPGRPGPIDLVGFADATLGPEAAAGFASAGSGAVGGRPALRLDGPDGTWWVASTGPPYPLRLESRSPASGAAQYLELSEFDRQVTVVAPPDPVDLRERAGRG